MRKWKRLMLLLVRIVLGAIILYDVAFAWTFVRAYQRGGIQGVRNHASFYHLEHHRELRFISSEELVREAQRGYEATALLMISLAGLTWAGFWVNKRLTRSVQQETSKDAPGG